MSASPPANGIRSGSNHGHVRPKPMTEPGEPETGGAALGRIVAAPKRD
tara:strand:+ start:617 stop:760 length:144 start_codon:yes stop_codon:yes gene_type:complete